MTLSASIPIREMGDRKTRMEKEEGRGARVEPQDPPSVLLEERATGDVPERVRRVSMAEQYFAQLEALRQVGEKHNPGGEDLSPELVRQMAMELGHRLEAGQLTQALAEMDSNNDGAVSPTEFEAWVKRQMMQRKYAPQQPTTRAEGEDHEQSLRPPKATKRADMSIPIREDAARAALGYAAFTNAAAWAAFRKLDKDNNGFVDRAEFAELSHALNLKLSKQEMNDAWRLTLDPLETGEATFDDFCVFFNQVRNKERTRLLRKVDSWFKRVDANGDNCTHI